jgi:hypothetical protein
MGQGLGQGPARKTSSHNEYIQHVPGIIPFLDPGNGPAHPKKAQIFFCTLLWEPLEGSQIKLWFLKEKTYFFP